MNEELQKALEQLLAKMINGVEQASDFAIEQVPEVIQQALFWFALKSSIVFGISVVMILCSAFAVRWSIKDFWVKNDEGKVEIDYIGERSPRIERAAALVIGVIAMFIFLINLFNNLAWLQILVAPKWFIVSEMSKLL